MTIMKITPPHIASNAKSLEARIELRHLRYFRAVAEELSFSRASERLHIAQPPLSQQVKQLESELGVLLIDRDNRPLRLTDAGQYLLEKTQELFASINTTIGEVRGIGLGLTGRISIGFAGSTMYNLLPDIVNTYRDQYPMVELVFKEMLAAEIHAAIETHKIDIGFSRPGIEVFDNIEQVLLVKEPLVVAIPERHPFSKNGCLDIEKLDGEAVILYPQHPRPSLTDLIIETLHAKHVRIRIVQEVTNLQTALGMVAARVGITFVPASVGEHERAGIQFLPLNPQVLFSPLTAVWRRNNKSASLHNFLNIMQQYLPNEKC